jgi:hypothetical protein
MAFWIQDKKDSDPMYRFFYAEFETDILNLPTQTEMGKQDPGNDVELKAANAICGEGSECLLVATGDVYVLGKTTNTWDKLGG